MKVGRGDTRQGTWQKRKKNGNATVKNMNKLNK